MLQREHAQVFQKIVLASCYCLLLPWWAVLLLQRTSDMSFYPAFVCMDINNANPSSALYTSAGRPLRRSSTLISQHASVYCLEEMFCFLVMEVQVVLHFLWYCCIDVNSRAEQPVIVCTIFLHYVAKFSWWDTNEWALGNSILHSVTTEIGKTS